jgi:hypothetical protein
MISPQERDHKEFPFETSVKLGIIKYWMKVKNSETILINAGLEDREQCEDEWSRYTCIRLELNDLGLGFTCKFDQFDTQLIILIEQRLYDIYTQYSLNTLKTSHMEKIINTLWIHLAYNIT